MDGWIDGRLGVACSAGQTRCSFCTRAAEKAAEKIVITASRSEAMKSLPAAASSFKADSVVSTPTAATSNIADEVAFSARSETVDVDHETSDSDYGSDPDQELEFMQSSGGAQDMQSSGDAQNMQSLGDAQDMQSRRDEQDIYDVASNLSHSTTIEHQKAFDLYETRSNSWGRVCIPCSFIQEVRVDGPHSDCMQERHAESLKDMRLKVEFTRYIACWSCGQPQFICSNRGKGKCKQPDLLWHVCWTAYALDTKYKTQIIQSLGGPQVAINPDVRRNHKFLKWLGEKSFLFNLPVSNAARLTYQWLDRLEERCSKRFV